MKVIKDLISCYKYFSKFAWKNNKYYFVFSSIRLIENILGPFISILGTRYLIDELIPSHRSISRIAVWVAVLCVGNFIYQNVAKIMDENLSRINENFGRLLDTKLCMSCINMKFEYTEDTGVLNLIKNAQRSLNETVHVNGLISPLFDVISNVAVLLGVVVLVCTSLPWLLVPITLSFIVKYIVENKINRFRRKYFEENGEIERGGDYFNTELQEGRYAKDIRLYEAEDIFNENYDKVIIRLYNRTKYYVKKFIVLYSIDDLIVKTLSIVVDFLLGIYTLLGRITIGQFSSLFQATTQFNTSLHAIVRRYTDMTYTVSILKYYVEFVYAKLEDQKDKTKKDVIETTDKETFAKDCNIEFRNVSFKYPRTDRYILRDVSIKIKAGEHISIVGENGAGKTTFIKLLCGLYDDYEGEILVNGKNIKSYTFYDYMRFLAVVFQDFRLFAFSLRDNITVFDENNQDMDKIYEISNLKDWVGRLKDGDKTHIYKYFVEDGVEPSGGEAQKLAIARALYKNAPIVVLDEPTAAMDPISEYEIYKNFDGLVKNKTAVYISHRLSSCRFCDRIVVFDDGNIIEDGTHEELIKLHSGYYANMYKTQAQWYITEN